MKPFRVEVPEADLRERLQRTRGPEAETVADWSQGVPLETLAMVLDDSYLGT